MKRSGLIWGLSVFICLLAGCSDEAQENSVPKVNGDPQDSPCEGNDCEPSDSTDEENVCQENSRKCVDKTTIRICKAGKEAEFVSCPKGCEAGGCVEDVDPPADVCTESRNECQDDKILTICVEGEPPQTKDCSLEGDGHFCQDDACVALPKIGDPCTDDSECPEEAFCDQFETQTCIPWPKLGEQCDSECITGLECVDDICVEIVNTGDACGDLAVCREGRCHQGVCKPVSMEFEACHADLLCPSGTFCTDGICVPTKGECTSNDNCTGDSFCCLDDSCEENINVCVPYSNENANDASCVFKTVPGMFEAAVQCYWEPQNGAGNNSVLNTVSVGKLHNQQNLTIPLIAFITASNPNNSDIWLRIIHPETCESIEDIQLTHTTYGSYNHISLADFDGDGYMEMVLLNGTNLNIYHWNGTAHVPTATIGGLNMSGGNGTFSIHDLDNDGVPEIIGTNGTVVRSDGTVLSLNSVSACSYTSPILGDLDGDGNVEFFSENNLYRWGQASNGWTRIATLTSGLSQIQAAYADFGTPGTDASVFDFEQLDGRAEIVLASGRALQVWAVFAADGSMLPAPQQLMSYSFPSSQSWGYPPAIGDFNGDGKPEIGVASRSSFGVYDPKCTGPLDGKCKNRFVIWESATKDGSGIAGASAFDFDADGKIEIVYGDECYTRVYDGTTGEVLFSSYRNSGTVIEYPVIADVDDDGSTEIVISSDNSRCGMTQDTSHRGVKCEVDADCYSGTCVNGLCRCTSDEQCNWQTIRGEIFQQYACLSPLAGDTEGGNVCRAVQGKTMPGVTVLRDRLDRWVSSRPVWNQHAYNITNVNDDGSIPKTEAWQQNFTIPGLNNYRQQKQGTTGAGVAPDITGRFTSAADACKEGPNGISLTAQVCNRGTKAVGTQMPAVFYKGSIAPENILCVSYTEEIVPVAGCRDVSCNISKEVAVSLTDETIFLLVNDDGKGGKTTVECNDANNTDKIVMAGCQIN